MIQKKLITPNLKKTPLWRKKLATLNLKKTSLWKKTSQLHNYSCVCGLIFQGKWSTWASWLWISLSSISSPSEADRTYMARLLAERTSNVWGRGDECKQAAYGQCYQSGSICLYASANVSSHLAPGIDVKDLHVIGQVNINTQKNSWYKKNLLLLT